MEELMICRQCGHEIFWRTDAGKPRWAHKDTGLCVCNPKVQRAIKEVPCAEPIIIGGTPDGS